MHSYQFVVIGAGVAGLSCAFHLEPADLIVLEGRDTVGGICRTHVRDEFVFDHVAHFLHLRDPRSRALVESLLPDTFETHQRAAAIYIEGRYIPHPFQAHLSSLPPKLLRDCLVGFIEARGQQLTDPPAAAPNLLEWFRRTFGDGMTDYFFEPHNRKTYCCAVSELTREWALMYVPQPTVAQIVDGVLSGALQTGLGYNSTIMYPRTGGIDVLPKALAARVKSLRCGERVVSIDVSKHVVTCASGASYGYESLISTMPLNRLLAVVDGLPASLCEAALQLRAADVIDLQLGVEGTPQIGADWVYFPEAHFPFVRVVVPSHVSPALAPPGMSTIHVEINVSEFTSIDADALLAESVRQLSSINFLTPNTRILSQTAVRVAGAYVVHDAHREGVLPLMFSALRERNIHCVGRYGAWTYGSIESALLDGMDLAARLTSPRSQPESTCRRT